MARNDKFMVHYAEGRGVNLGKAKNKVQGWAEFCKQFSTPTKTKERRKQYDKLPNDQQAHLKGIDGWIIGAPVSEGKRTNATVQPRDLLSLDFDYATPRFVSDIENDLTGLSENEFFVHSSRRHTEEKPRLRLFAPLSRLAKPDEYPALARILAQKLDPEMKMVDKVSFRRSQMMFKPTISIDGEFFCHRCTGDLIDVDAVLDEFERTVGDWRDHKNLPRAADEDELRQHAEKAEDPTTKKGPVGDFCRAYDVEAAIAKFLPDKYEPTDEHSVKPRYTYLGGTTSSGAVVEDGGLFLYSHHGSDPCADMLVNAFDLVRIHLFGDKDEGEDKDTPATKWPSYKAMLDFIADDSEYRRSQAESRYDMAAMFDDIADDYFDEEPPENTGKNRQKSTESSDDPDSAIQDEIDEFLGSGAGSPAGGPERPSPGKPGKSTKAAKRKPPKGWFPDQLELDQNGRIQNTLPNASIIIHNDARLYGGIAYNAFWNQIVCCRSIRSKLDIVPDFICEDVTNGDRWQDKNDISIRAILEAPNGEGKRGYGMKLTDRDLAGAITLTALRNKFHPIQDYLDALEWDGVARLDSLFVRFLACPDTDYHRQIARWMLVASVARIFEPGHKFDYAAILGGPQGIGKSTFVKTLYSEKWFGELDCKLDDRQAVAEAVAGKWGMELPELSGFHKSDHNSAKQFMRRTTDDIRMAYDRRVSEFPRQCVFWGTTNDAKYLKDPTGNRSYWPLLVGVEVIDTAGLADERDQLWAEAVHIYRAMRETQPHGDLPLTLQGTGAIEEAKAMQEEARTMELHEAWAEQIAIWADEPVLLTQLLNEYDLTAQKFPRGGDDINPETTWVRRTAFRVTDASHYALGKPKIATDYQHVQNVDRAMALLRGWQKEGPNPTRRFGQQGRWKVRVGADPADIARGYEIIPSPSGGDESLRDLDPEAHDLI